jgi:hypothetical protein
MRSIGALATGRPGYEGAGEDRSEQHVEDVVGIEVRVDVLRRGRAQDLVEL